MIIIKENIKYNSPKNAKNPYIFSKKSLIYLINTWNKHKPDKIIYKKTDAISKLSQLLNEKIKPICDDKQYWCWPGTISKIANNAKTKDIIKMIEKEIASISSSLQGIVLCPIITIPISIAC